MGLCDEEGRGRRKDCRWRWVGAYADSCMEGCVDGEEIASCEI